MSKLTVGILAGAALATAAVLAPLAAAGSGEHDITLNAAAAAPTGGPTAAASVATVATPTVKPVAKPVVTTTKAPVVTLLVPAPAKALPTPDPRSAACINSPTTPYCTVTSVRYLVKGTTDTAHAQWIPALTKWGLTNVVDGCTDPANQAAQSTFCVLRGTHGTQNLTVLFKQTFDGQYAPKAVETAANAIHTKAMSDAEKAKTVTVKAKIIQSANAKITALQATADAWNAAHPQSSVIVAVTH